MHTTATHPEVRELADALYREHRYYLLAIARKNAVNDADAEEALQEVFSIFVRSFDPQGGAPPLAWLTLALKRQCWRQRRDAHLDRYVGQEAEDGTEEAGFSLATLRSEGPDHAERFAERDEAHRLLARLESDQRTALGLLAAGFTRSEIAEHCGWRRIEAERAINSGRWALGSGLSY
jgi:RNA polymerase sigma factor (sigma-70 family)